jgi:SNF2 family DNA or RNA helicase
MKIIQPGNPPPPREHQLEALKFARDKDDPTYFGLFMDPGTGKTKVALDKMAELWRKRRIEVALVLAPNGVHTQWVEEQIPEHMTIPCRTLVWSSHRTKRWKDEARWILKKRDALLVVAMNYEALTTKDGLNFCRWLLEARVTGIFADESSRIRNPRAIRTKSALDLSKNAAARVIMTGTPLVKGFENLWSQMQFLSPDILDCRSFVQFRSLYCKTRPIPGRRGAIMISGYQRTDELLGLVHPHVFVKSKEDCLDLPEKIYSKSPIPLTNYQRDAYESMRDQLIVELENLEKVTVAHLISARAKLRQIAIGFILDKEGKVATFPTVRWDRALEHIEEAPGKVILWTTYRYCLAQWEAILEKNKIGFIRYAKGHNDLIRHWRKDPDCKVFLGNPHSGGIGLNLAAATTMVYFNNTDDAEIRWQSEDRAHRIGQDFHLNIIDMFSPQTVETKIQEQQKTKESLANIVMKRGWREVL